MNKNSNYWEDYYVNNSPDKIPWTGSSEKFFNNIWEKHKLPKKGNLLDVGCGRGDKAIYLANNFKLKVWAFDISETAIKAALKQSADLENKPILFKHAAQNIGKAKEIKHIQFNVIIDLVTTQFMEQGEIAKYLQSLKSHLIPSQTFYILNTFIKDNNEDKMEGYVDWVKKIAQSPEMMKDTYFKYFKVKEKWVRPTPKGKVGTFILIAK